MLAHRFIPAWAGNTLNNSISTCHAPVHPRVGGEHVQPSGRQSVAPGSSPRGRGTLSRRQHHQSPVRFIPAWAGNAPMAARTNARSPVHPRVGGEHVEQLDIDLPRAGSSPRGRGTRPAIRAPVGCARFIPAWAGNTLPPPAPPVARPVHPRVGGEHIDSMRRWSSRFGSSPRGRGTRPVSRADGPGGRFIPAWAGNTVRRSRQSSASPVHPRVGGAHIRNDVGCEDEIGSSPRGRGHVIGTPPSGLDCGSSPRGRGTPPASRHRLPRLRFIPAWAGNTLALGAAHRRKSVHPRVGGEHRSGHRTDMVIHGSSPRGRGTHLPGRALGFLRRFIPAWAGNTYVVVTPPGGTHGSSPRGRGTPRKCKDAPNPPRFIPAWAGNTP